MKVRGDEGSWFQAIFEEKKKKNQSINRIINHVDEYIIACTDQLMDFEKLFCPKQQQQNNYPL